MAGDCPHVILDALVAPSLCRSFLAPDEHQGSLRCAALRRRNASFVLDEASPAFSRRRGRACAWPSFGAQGDRRRLPLNTWLCYIRHMARGKSGRLVVEIDPLMKRELHAKVARDGRTLKDWLVEQAQRYLAEPPPETRSVTAASEVQS